MTIDYSKRDNMDTDSEPEISLPTHHIARCDVEKIRFAPWSVAMIQVDHPIFPNYIPPVPLAFHHVGTQSANRADLDNQMITYLNIDHESEFAPSEWRSYIDTVVIAQKDKKPLLPQHLQGKEIRSETGGENDVDDWRAVRSSSAGLQEDLPTFK
ncbi:hypothetical protein EDB81DRAFT_844255 [Dactylonectria macrodidyma]|uniref:Uncharacterized protein n=1 Tax=Dactylonectria macrodidyma TaxID=307937 RepID=A0A9P9EE77_9HYPO|nr:hypothetical protein EDB81DRAFT_844255 [Dactylonectria macrodidyma]